MKNLHVGKRNSGGFTLLEVLIGMVIFALGMMALAQLQGNLSKSSGDSNARSVATNIAEETIEAARTFVQVTGGAGTNAFNNIVSGSSTIRRGGIDYTVTSVVTDYYYQAPVSINGNGTFTTTKPANKPNADMKMMQLTVAWGTGQNFHVDDSAQDKTLGSGSITLTDVISSITSPSGGKVVLNATTNELYGPPVDYSPGQNPEIVSIHLGENRFKESTTPLPRVYNANERVETVFDVVTYSQNDLGATFLRREEFLTVACECKLKVPSDSTQGGLRPTIWNGNDYTEGEFVVKPYGESVRDNSSNFQSEFCGVCCRDHHDGGSGANDVASDTGRQKFNPFKSSTEYFTAAESSALVGDHKHYGVGGVGLVTTNGATYFEACRLVRKDGFMRVAQDLRQEGLNSFPDTYLDDDSEVTAYSNYVTDAVSLFSAAAGDNYEQSSPVPTLTAPLDMSPQVKFPAATTTNRTTMSPAKTSQQLRSRGIYVDYMTDDLRDIVDCLGLSGATGPGCGVEGANSALEIIPFYDVQLTWLARWNESPINAPIKVTNDQAIQTGNTHDRGRAILVSQGESTITTKINRGNLGLTGSDPIDGNYVANIRTYPMYALGISSSNPLPTEGYTVSGTITSKVGSVKASDVEIQAINGPQCDRTPTGYTCIVPYGASNPRLNVSNYFKTNWDLVGCSLSLSTNGTEHSGTNPAQNYTRFNLPLANLNNADIYIKSGLSCP